MNRRIVIKDGYGVNLAVVYIPDGVVGPFAVELLQETKDGTAQSSAVLAL